ncbi:MAG: cell division protein FtsA [Candidatus Hydrogenedentes bacterium]|nr:cell division protein FtsA [Candidatus Hydrogenedentota bacterium]
MRIKGEVVGAVDFGSRDIRVLIARKEEDGTIQVVGHGVAPGRGCISQGVIQDLNAAQVTLKRALAAAEKEARVRVNSLFCGVNGKNVETFIREGIVKVERGVVEQSHMGEALDIASRDILAAGKRILASVTAQEWYVDDLRVLDPVGIRGQVLKMRVHFARLPSVIEDNVIACVESQKRELEDIIFMPLASSLGCLTPEDIELGAAVLDIGRSTTGLAVYRDYRILGTQCFEWGGYHLTRDVAAGLQVSFEEADELILEYGISDEFVRNSEEDDDAEAAAEATPESNEGRSARIKLKTSVHGAPSIVDRKKLDLIIYERAKELMTKVRQHLNARGLSKHLVRGVVLTGGAGAIKNHAALAEAIFQVPCRVGIPDSVEILPHAVNSPEFSAAVGIVRHAFEHRAAAKRGRIEPRGPVVSSLRRVGKFLRKYFI